MFLGLFILLGVATVLILVGYVVVVSWDGGQLGWQRWVAGGGRYHGGGWHCAACCRARVAHLSRSVRW